MVDYISVQYYRATLILGKLTLSVSRYLPSYFNGGGGKFSLTFLVLKIHSRMICWSGFRYNIVNWSFILHIHVIVLTRGSQYICGLAHFQLCQPVETGRDTSITDLMICIDNVWILAKVVVFKKWNVDNFDSILVC